MEKKSYLPLKYSAIKPLIGLLFDPDFWPNIEYFSNSKAGSSFSPNLD